MEHFSERFDRNFKDDDWLTRDEVAEVLTANSGRAIKPEYVTELARQGILHPDRSAPRGLRYPYWQVKSYVVKPGPGRRAADNPSPGALRKRRYVQKHGKKKESRVA